MISFQGSDSCTSDGILNAYARAEKLASDPENKSIPVFVFDEIGLAELSKYNPLKVLHSLLDKKEGKIAFIGISNWRLDASKMNRGLYLARPDPDRKDLEFTAISIFKSICPFNQYDGTIKNLAKAYFKLKDNYRQNMPEYADFYGLRDFYNIVKQVSRFISNPDQIRE